MPHTTSNYSPAAFQSDTFQANPIAFQLDHHIEDEEWTDDWTPQAPQGDGVMHQTPKTNSWTPQDQSNPTQP